MYSRSYVYFANRPARCQIVSVCRYRDINIVGGQAGSGIRKLSMPAKLLANNATGTPIMRSVRTEFLDDMPTGNAYVVIVARW